MSCCLCNKKITRLWNGCCTGCCPGVRWHVGVWPQPADFVPQWAAAMLVCLHWEQPLTGNMWPNLSCIKIRRGSWCRWRPPSEAFRNLSGVQITVWGFGCHQLRFHDISNCAKPEYSKTKLVESLKLSSLSRKDFFFCVSDITCQVTYGTCQVIKDKNITTVLDN